MELLRITIYLLTKEQGVSPDSQRRKDLFFSLRTIASSPMSIGVLPIA